MLISRTFLFAFFQVIIALLLSSWAESTRYWMLTATLTNVISIIFLIILFRKEKINYLSIFHFIKDSWKKDLLIFSGLAIISLLFVMIPPLLLESGFLGDSGYFQEILFQPISPYLMYFLLFAFPITIGFAELATYFGYIMPRLKKHLPSKWLVVLLPVFFLSIQHCTLPLVFDAKFILFRGLTYLPFALLLGIVLYKRPSLLPHFAILHVALDGSAALMFLLNS